MLGRKDFTNDEASYGEAAVQRQLAAVDALPKAAQAALEKADHFNDLALALDRRYVHRLRSVTGKDGTPLNELEMIVESLLNHDGELREINVIKYKSADSVVGLKAGDHIRLTRDDFARLSAGVFDELRAKYC
jgi:vacuolar-type H+-ATPase subunit C/Vma6